MKVFEDFYQEVLTRAKEIGLDTKPIESSRYLMKISWDASLDNVQIALPIVMPIYSLNTQQSEEMYNAYLVRSELRLKGIRYKQLEPI